MSVGPEALLVLANAAAVVLGTAAVLLAGVVYIRVKPYDKALLITTGMLLALPFVVAAFTLSPTNFLTVVGVVLHAFGVPYGIALALNFAVGAPRPTSRADTHPSSSAGSQPRSSFSWHFSFFRLLLTSNSASWC